MFRERVIIINDGPVEHGNRLLKNNAKQSSDRALFYVRNPFNLPVTTEKLKLRPSGSSDGIGSALAHETKPDCSARARRKSQNDPGFPAN